MAVNRLRSMVSAVAEPLEEHLHNEMRLGNLAANVAGLSVMPVVVAGGGDAAGGDEDGDDIDSIRRTLTYDEYRSMWRAQVADWAGTSVRMVEEIYRHRLHEVAKLGPVKVPDLEI